MAILKELHPMTGHGEWVFPSQWQKNKPIGKTTLLAALRGMGISDEEITPHGFRAWLGRFWTKFWVSTTILSSSSWRTWCVAQTVAPILTAYRLKPVCQTGHTLATKKASNSNRKERSPNHEGRSATHEFRKFDRSQVDAEKETLEMVLNDDRVTSHGLMILERW